MLACILSSLPSRSRPGRGFDPFAVLGLEPTAALDRKEIKRAYAPLLKFHLTLSQDSPKSDKAASDRFMNPVGLQRLVEWQKREMDAYYRHPSSSSKPVLARFIGIYASAPTQAYSASGSSSARSTDWRLRLKLYGDNTDDDKSTMPEAIRSVPFSDLFGGASSAAAYTAGLGLRYLSRLYRISRIQREVVYGR
jgi:hypothetical protein